MRMTSDQGGWRGQPLPSRRKMSPGSHGTGREGHTPHCPLDGEGPLAQRVSCFPVGGEAHVLPACPLMPQCLWAGAGMELSSNQGLGSWLASPSRKIYPVPQWHWRGRGVNSFIFPHCPPDGECPLAQTTGCFLVARGTHALNPTLDSYTGRRFSVSSLCQARDIICIPHKELLYKSPRVL